MKHNASSANPSLPRPPTSGSGFSLVELSLAILLVALLSLIGIGVGRTATDRMREARCAQNLRQLYTGFLAHAADFGGRFPFGPPIAANAAEADYLAKAGDQINASYYSGIYARRMKVYLPGAMGANTGYCEPYLCPSDREPRGNYAYGFLGHSYGFNMTIARDQYNLMSTWRYPARAFLLADSKKDMLARTLPNVNLDPRHDGHANTLFLDGHVEKRKSPFPTWSEERRFWVPDYD